MFGDGDVNSSNERGLRPSTSAPQVAKSFDSTLPVIDFVEYWRLLVKHRLLIGGAFLAALVVGLVVTLLTTPTYMATSTVQIDREAARIFNVEDVQPQESMIQGEEFFQTEYGILRSRSLTDRVVDKLGLASSDAFIEQMGETPPARSDETAAQQASARRDAVVKLVQDNLAISPIRGSRLVSISFVSPDPILSARLANAFSENYIEANLARKFDSSSYARDFLEDEIGRTKARLEEAERELVAYAADEEIINVREASDQTGEAQSLATNNLVTLNDALAESQGARIAAEEKWRQAQSSNVFSIAEVLQNPTVQRLTEERAKLNAEYQQGLSLYQAEWPEMLQLKARVDELDDQIGAIANRIRNSIRSDYTIALNRELSLAAQVSGLKGSVLDLRSRSIQYNILQREVDTSRTLYDGLLQRYKEVGVSAGVAANNISIVDKAEVPRKPSGPQMLLNLLVAGLIGLGAGVVAALLIEALDETLASPEDVETKLHMPVLGVIPLLDRSLTPQAALANARSAFSEAYYSLRTALQFSTPDGVPASILVTSSRPGEGKSTTAYATAMTLSRLGRKVLLVDGDLRNPSMHRLVGVDNKIGLSNLLAGVLDLSSVIHSTAHEGLSFIPCGPLPPNPAELWGGDGVNRMLRNAIQGYDHIVIDGPPVLGFADAPLLASAVAGTIFVIEAKGTRRAQARGALRRLGIGEGRIVGIVLSKFNTKTTPYGGYDYTYDYSYGSGAGDQGDKAGRR